MIRKATQDDVLSCAVLAREFFGEYLERAGIPVRYEDVFNTTTDYIKRDSVIVVEHDGKVTGCASWVITSHPANSLIKIFYETIWCVKSGPFDMIAMLGRLEEEAKNVGADIIIMANLNGKVEKSIDKIYKARGFKFIETHYAKKVRV